jgi:hypothetical protein
MTTSELVGGETLLRVSGATGWVFAPEGAAVHLGERTAVIADVHLGYEWARASHGDVVPSHSLDETIAKLTSLFDRAEITRLVVAGDLVESPRFCPKTSRDVLRLFAWLKDRNVDPVWVRGNHDPSRDQPTSLVLDGWDVRHGDRALPKGRCIFGHHHPALKAGGLSAPCFLVGETTIALPAFSPNAAGLNVVGTPLPKALAREPLRCLAGLGGTLLDFGQIGDLVAKLRSP